MNLNSQSIHRKGTKKQKKIKVLTIDSTESLVFVFFQLILICVELQIGLTYRTHNDMSATIEV